MKKVSIFILSISILFTTFVSYFIYKTGITDKLVANINNIIANNKESIIVSDLPIINMVYNSSGEDITNTSVAITVNAKSNYNIVKLEYSYDLKNWISLNKKYNSKNIEEKLLFDKQINKYVYIRVINEMGYKSYAYKTKVNIDKQKPILSINKKDNDFIIIASDNNNLKYLEYSYDSVNWDRYIVNNKKTYSIKIIDKNIYYRAVDEAGNISDIKRLD